jgi:uncharacterized tellurite resistance protein B-like protein
VADPHEGILFLVQIFKLVDMDIVTKKQLNILIQLAEADKHFAKTERDMIFRIAKERKFPEEDVHELIRNPQPIDSLGALSLDQKFEYLWSAIEMVFADQNVFESEVIFCKNIAIKLGFKKGIIDYFIEHYGNKTTLEFKEAALAEYI